MTTTNTAPPDLRPAFDVTTDLFAATLAAVRPDQLDGPTPCDEFTVRDLIGHLVGVARKIAIVGTGGVDDLPLVVDVPDGTATEAFAAGVAEQRKVWSDDAVLDTILKLGWTDMPARIALGMWVNEFLVHTWDLAVATGQTVDFPIELVDGSYEVLASMLADPPPEGVEIPFDPAVDPGPDPSPIERLVALQGRRPDWSPASA